MKYFIAMLMICASRSAFAQWHAASDTLKPLPPPVGYYNSIGYLDRYNVVPCYYTVNGSDQLFEGFKPVYIAHKGHYFDKQNTIGVFFDIRKQRVNNVTCYCFR